jgi:dTDP-4-dehydrorhamnose 3,5-epimerase
MSWRASTNLWDGTPVFEILPTSIDGVKLLKSKVHLDARGSFLKTFHAGLFVANGMDFTPREQFFSISKKNVLRGLHFQLPPSAHAKLVFCTSGRILDVVLDLRRGRNSRRVHSCELGTEGGEMLFIPKGCAHGFLALEENSTVFYLTDSEHDPGRDSGILWNSIGFDWGISDPALSQRDAAFPELAEFSSPFA